MSRKITYEKNKLPQLAIKLDVMMHQLDNLGYGSRAVAARWLMENGHQKGNPANQADVNRVAKKVAHILKGYVRGIHETMHRGGVWSAEEAEKIVDLLEEWIKTNPKILKYELDESSLRQPRRAEPSESNNEDEF